MPTLSNRLVQFQEQQKFTDVDFEFEDGTSCKCHKVHLAVYSVFLKLLFKYSDSDRYKLPKAQFMVIFEWAYQRRTPETGIVDTLLHADYLGATLLVGHCARLFAATPVGPSNYGWMLQLTHLQSSIQPLVVSRLAENAKEGFADNTEEFCRLPYEVLTALLRSDSFFVSPESYVWTIIKRWIKYDFEVRKGVLNDLLPFVKLGLIPLSECRQIRCDVASMCGGSSGSDMWHADLFDKIVRLQMWKQGLLKDPIQAVLLSVDSYMITPRMPRVCALASGGWSQALPSKELELYDHKSDFWYKLPVELPNPRAYHDAASFGTMLFVVGGFAGEERFKTMYRLDVHALTFEELPPLHKQRCFVSAAAVGGKLYCMGGFDGANESSRLASCETFDPETNQWTEITSMTEPRSDAAAAAHNGKIYVIGGFNGSNYLDTAEVYDPKSDTWTNLPNMHSKRGGIGCCVFKGKLYAIGGMDGDCRLRTVEFLDLAVDEPEWTSSQPMIQGRSNFGVCCVDDRIIAAGGYVDPATTSCVEWFDGFQWCCGASMSKNMSAFVLTPIEMTPELVTALEESRKQVLPAKRQQRLDALRDMLRSDNDAEDTNKMMVEMDPDSRMFDSFFYPS